MNIKKGDALILSSVFILSFTVRFLYLDETASSPVFLINTLRGTDMEGYIRWAAELAHGVYNASGAFWQAPLYPYFLAGVFKISGINLYIAALIQVFLSSFTCVLIYLISKEAFNRNTAAAAGFISCLYAPFIFYSPVILSETLGVFLISATLLPLVKSVESPELKYIIPGGFLLGLSALARPNFLLFAPFFLLYIFLKTKNLKKFSAYFIPFTLSLIAAILPVTVRNYAVSGRLVLISANFPETFRLSNSFDSLVLNYTEPSLGLMPLTSRAFWLHQIRKALYFWWGFEVPQNVNFELFREHSAILKLPLAPFWLLAPPAAAGIYFWAKSEYRRNKTLIIYVLTYYASIVVLYIVSRFRLPVMAGLIPFSAFGIVKTAEFLRRKRLKPAGVVILFYTLLSALIFPWSYPRIRGTDYRMLGIAMVREGLYQEALKPLGKSLEILPPAEREATEELIRQIRDIPEE